MVIMIMIIINSNDIYTSSQVRMEIILCVSDI